MSQRSAHRESQRDGIPFVQLGLERAKSGLALDLSPSTILRIAIIARTSAAVGVIR